MDYHRCHRGSSGYICWIHDGKSKKVYQNIRKRKAGWIGRPGGCVTSEECIKYCSEAEHFEECASFFGPGSMPQQEQHFPFQQERTHPIVELVLRFLLASVGLILGL